MSRVLITGLGCICALGGDVPTIWRAMLEGVCGIRPLGLAGPAPLKVAVAAEVQGLDPERHFDRQTLGRLDRFAQLALVAGREAVADAGLTLVGGLGPRAGVVLGSAIGGIRTQDEGFHRLYAEGGSRVAPLTVPRVMLNGGVSALSMDLGLQGAAFAVSSACSSSNHAIAQAAWLVRSGQLDLALAGGSEAPLCYGHLKGWEGLRILAAETCRPFSLGRDGLVLGEGAGVLVLESEAHARRRGARVLAELAGAGMCADAGDLLLPDPDGARRAMEGALAEAGLTPSQVDYINAHGTGTQANDVNETQAIRRVFGAQASRLAVSSTKSMHGHALGAAGGIEAVATVKAIAEGVLPPTVSYGPPDPACDLDYVPNQARPWTIRTALSNSFAFGGLNAVLAFRRPGG
jgi:nodulation protein E